VAAATGNINQIRVALTGFPGGPGVSTFYCDAASLPDLTNLRSFWNALIGRLMAGITIQVPASGDVLKSTTGELVSTWSAGAPPAAVVTTGALLAEAAAGAQVTWTTNDVADGHAVKGRTFLVPGNCSDFGADGQLSVAQQTVLASAAQLLVGATPPFVVWHRPKKGPKPSGGGPAPVIRTGSFSVITGKVVPRKGVVLTSRRD
jgi:hypothetical protein